MTQLINVTVKMFFDEAGLIAGVEDKTAKALSGAGALGRKIMQRGMRKRKKISAIRTWPSSHSGELRSLIYFGLAPDGASVAIGPTFFNNDKTVVGSSKSVPQLINEGGIITRLKKTRKLRRGRAPEIVTTRVRQAYQPRPFVDLTEPEASRALLKKMDEIQLKV